MFYYNSISYMDRVNELNARILARNNVSGNLDIQFNPRPQPTKYVFTQPNIKTLSKINNKNYNSGYDITKTFNPGTIMGPWSGYVTKVNDESILRNQIYSLNNCPHTQYIPSYNSDLYNLNIPNNEINPNNETNPNNVTKQSFPRLFETQAFSRTDNNISNKHSKKNLGNNIFNNDTRQQLKNN